MMEIVLWVLATNTVTVLVMYRIMSNLPGILEARAYEDHVKKLPWQDIKWLQETGSAATVTDDPRSATFRGGCESVVPRKPQFGIKISGEAELKVN